MVPVHCLLAGGEQNLVPWIELHRNRLFLVVLGSLHLNTYSKGPSSFTLVLLGNVGTSKFPSHFADNRMAVLCASL